MDDTTRIDIFTDTLRDTAKAGSPGNYNHKGPLDKLVTLTGNVNELCWEVAARTKRSDAANKIISADRIKHHATNIISICVDELESLGHTTEEAIKLIAIDGALWFWSLNASPLNCLDQEVDPIERIQSLYVAMGDLAVHWPVGASSRNPVEPADDVQRVFVNLAYEATCAIIGISH